MTIRDCKSNRGLPSRGVDPRGTTAGAIHCRTLSLDLAEGRGREPGDLQHSAPSAHSNRGDQPPGSFSQTRKDI